MSSVARVRPTTAPAGSETFRRKPPGCASLTRSKLDLALSDGADVNRISTANTTLLSLIFLALLSGCGDRRGEDKSNRLAALCRDSGGSSDDPCRISFLTLAANPDLFNDRHIRVAGYYTSGLDTLLFTDRESAEGGVTANAALLSMRSESELKSLKPEHLVLIEGKFLYTPPQRGEFNRPKAAGLIGELAEAKHIRGSAIGIPYRCWVAPPDKPENDERTDSNCP